jgi:hypothetical protein
VTASKSILSYDDAREVFERVAQSPNKGIRLTCPGGQKARDLFMFRLWDYRKLDREQNRILYPDPAHTMHGRSYWDKFVVRKVSDNQIEIEQVNIDDIEIVDL